MAREPTFKNINNAFLRGHSRSVAASSTHVIFDKLIILILLKISWIHMQKWGGDMEILSWKLLNLSAI